jgi:hypothetical protein
VSIAAAGQLNLWLAGLLNAGDKIVLVSSLASALQGFVGIIQVDAGAPYVNGSYENIPAGSPGVQIYTTNPLSQTPNRTAQYFCQGYMNYGLVYNPTASAISVTLQITFAALTYALGPSASIGANSGIYLPFSFHVPGVPAGSTILMAASAAGCNVACAFSEMP